MREDKRTMTLEDLIEKYDLNTKWRRVRRFPKSDKDLKFYTLESFHNSMLNEYKFSLQNDPYLTTDILAVYASISKEYPLPYVITIEYFPANQLQAQSVDLMVDIMLEQMGEHMRVEYYVRTGLVYNNCETLVSVGTSFEGERIIKAFDVIRTRRNQREDMINFKETHKIDGEYLNIHYNDPKEQKKKEEFDKLKESMAGV